MSEMKLVGCDVPYGELAELDNLDPETWPTGVSRLRAPNGAATMHYDGEMMLNVVRRSYRPEEDVVLDVTHSEINGEIELTATEAFRLGLALIAHGEEEYTND